MTMILIATMFGGCQTLNHDAKPAAPNVPAVSLSRDCEDLAKKPPIPKAVKGQSRRKLLMRTRVALVAAIDSLDDTTECQRLQRERLAKGGRR
jgi:hypothetical protein